MIIATWNVNSIKVRKNLLSKLIDDYLPDVICLQETKVDNASFPISFFENKGFNCFANGIRSYNGVAILSKKPQKKVFIHNHCDKKDARHIEVEIDGLSIHSVYVPAGGDEPDTKINEKFEHKVNFLKELNSFMRKRNNEKIILCGDLNVAPNPDDVWSHKQLINVVSHTEIEIQLLNEIIENGRLVDVVRNFINPPKNIFTWWSYRSPDFRLNNRGRRLDHIIVSKALANKVLSAKIIDTYRDEPRPSDHVPVLIEIK